MKIELQIYDPKSDDPVDHFNVDLTVKFTPDNLALWNVICKELAKQEKAAKKGMMEGL